MKNRLYITTISLILAITMLCPVVAMGANDAKAASEVVSTTININENNVIKPADKRLLGFNNDSNWHNAGSVSEGSSSMTNFEFGDVFHQYGMKVPLVRGFFHDLDWTKTVGPDRGLDKNGGAYAFGLPEWIKTIRAITPSVEFVITLNVEDEVADIQNMIRYLLLRPDDENATDANGVNWAQLRVDDGILEPVTVACFELGNETDLELIEDYHSMTDDDVYRYANTYVDYVSPMIDAIKDVTKDAKVSVLTFSTPTVGTTLYDCWNSTVIRACGARVDYIAMHYYYHRGLDGTTNANQYWYFEDFRLNMQYKKYVDELDCEVKPKVFLSEHANYIDPQQYNEKTGLYYGVVTSLTGALVTSECINRMCNREDVEIAAYHSFYDSPKTMYGYEGKSWGAIRPCKENEEFQMMVIGEYYKLAYDAFGDNVVECERIADGHEYCTNGTIKGGNQLLTATAHTTTDGSLRVLLTNQNVRVGHNLTFNMQNKYKLEKEVVLTDKNVFADNSFFHTDTYYAKKYQRNEETEFTNYYMPPQSIVALYLTPIYEEYDNKVADITFLENDGESVNCTDGILMTEIDAFVDGAFYNSDGIFVRVTDSTGENTVAFDYCDMLRKRAFFSCVLPEDGDYIMYVTDGKHTAEKAFNAKILNTPYETVHNISVDLTENCMNYEIKFSNESIFEDKYTLMVESANGDLCYYNVLPKTEDTASGSLYLPLHFGSGLYKFIAICGEDMYVEEFNFNIPDEILCINAVTVEGTDQKYNFADYIAGKKLEISLENISEQDKNYCIYVAEYDNSGKLCCVTESETFFVEAGKSDKVIVPAKTCGKTPALIKIFTWEPGISPLNMDLWILN